VEFVYDKWMLRGGVEDGVVDGAGGGDGDFASGFLELGDGEAAGVWIFADWAGVSCGVFGGRGGGDVGAGADGVAEASGRGAGE
jgi:hypothetical protein